MQVYKLTFPDGTIYVGATTHTVLQRVKKHYEARNSLKAKNRLIMRAFKTHGLNVKIDVLAECENKELLLLAEMEAIQKHNSLNANNKLGLNVVRGGLGMRVGDTHSEYKKQWCKANKERLTNKGKSYYQENKDRLKQSAKDYHEQNKERNLARNRDYARLHKEENNARASKFQKENRERTNEKNRAWRASRTPEQKAEIAAKAKARKDANRDEINRKERERRQMKRDLLKGQG